MLPLYCQKGVIECGVDEVGRGALAGPVVAAAVVWSPEYDEDWNAFVEDIQDSKLLSPHRRKQLAQYIQHHAVDWSVAFVDHHVIDQKNILEATYDAMHQAIDKLQVPVEHILVDGNRFRPHPCAPHTCVVKGDNAYLSIAAASILAKVARDEYMQARAQEPTYAMYGWGKNLGYGTAAHVQAITKHGRSDLHRNSFRVKGVTSEGT